ncbi:MAG TPA: hypothetical protein VF668_22400 [Pyrinomonadaceae bacterium]|jgi:hypothetical protein
MEKSPRAANWLLVVPALPLALNACLILFDILLELLAVTFLFSVVVGCAVLLVDAVLIIKGSVSLRQWRTSASIILAAADVTLPLIFLAIVGLAIRGLLKML